MVWLLIDDLRDIKCELIARTYQSGLDLLKSNYTEIHTLVLDHDLGEERTGYHLIKEAIQLNIVPQNVIIVSSNPVGVANISNALQSFGYKFNPDHRHLTRVEQ